uniref:uncharacterized protein C3orf26 homolog n=1 Tax=Nyctereutes procyonoides TaxID=34880 RepID=UPI00244380E3|nr:uncharacterized protein C3orf26 homolog [Nyctereutes procyonoides]
MGKHLADSRKVKLKWLEEKPRRSKAGSPSGGSACWRPAPASRLGGSGKTCHTGRFPVVVRSHLAPPGDGRRSWRRVWEKQPAGAASSPEASDGERGGDTETMQQETAPVPAQSKKTKQPKECFLIKPKETKEDATKTRRRRKKKITDVLAKSEPKPGTPEDLQNLMKDYFSSSRSVTELEELNLPDSCFLKANDLTHSLSSYLREICPMWVKLRKNHNEKKSVLMLIICSSAVRALELIRSMTAFRGDSKVMKLFAKHIKVQEQVKLLEKRVVHLGVGTPGRIKELIKQDENHPGLNEPTIYKSLQLQRSNKLGSPGQGKEIFFEFILALVLC